MSSLKSPDPRKVEALQNDAPLINVSEVRSLLNCAVFCSRFIRPLREPTCNGVKWQWTDEEQSSFEWLKAALSTKTTLGYFDPKKPTSIFVDGSPIGLGAVQTNKDVSTNELTPLHYWKSFEYTLLCMQVISSMYIRLNGNVFPKLSPDWVCTII